MVYLPFQWNGNIEDKSFILLIILQFFFLLHRIGLQVFKYLNTVKLRVKVSGLGGTSSEAGTRVLEGENLKKALTAHKELNPEICLMLTFPFPHPCTGNSSIVAMLDFF